MEGPVNAPLCSCRRAREVFHSSFSNHRLVGEGGGGQTSNSNFDVLYMERAAVEGSTGCYGNTENQPMLRGVELGDRSQRR